MKSEDKEFSWWMERSPGQLRLAVAGDLDLAARGVLQDAVIDLLRKYLPSGDSVVLDLTRVGMIDSTGLAELVRALNVCDDVSVRWSLVPSPAVRRLLIIVGLGRLERHDTGIRLSGE
jgi:anti-anti-sigma factor